MVQAGIYRVFGLMGADQEEAKEVSFCYDFSREGKTRILVGHNADATGTGRFVLIDVICDDPDGEMRGQLSDGIFENYDFGKVQKLVDGKFVDFDF